MEEEFFTGCLLQPDGISAGGASFWDYAVPAGIANENLDIEKVKAFIVPAAASLFSVSEDGEVTLVDPGEVSDQKRIPACVGHATANSKTTQEGHRVSPRDIYRQAKKVDGLGGPLTYGTTLGAAADVLVSPGAASESLVPVPESLEEFVSERDLSADAILSRTENQGSRTLFVNRWSFKSALKSSGTPIVTSCEWYESDNRIGSDGMMAPPTGRDLGGHAFAVYGFGKRNGIDVYVVKNSWGTRWGDRGWFYVPVSLESRMTNGFIPVDRVPDAVTLAMKYANCVVRVPGKPEHYIVNRTGELRKFPDEIVFWACGHVFGQGVCHVTEEELSVFKKGPDVSIEEANPNTRELVRQVRQFYNLK